MTGRWLEQEEPYYNTEEEYHHEEVGGYYYYDDYYDYDDDYVPSWFGKPLTVAWGPKIPALLSMWGSYIIIREVLADLRVSSNNNSQAASLQSRRRSRSSSNHCRPLSRVLLSLSISDCLSSIAWFLSTWMFPSNMIGGEYTWGNIGSWTTCNLQGFLVQLGQGAGPLFNTTYALFSLLLLRYRWTDRQLVRVEPYFHVGIWTMAIGLALFPIFLDFYNPVVQVCWIEPYPYNCESGNGPPCTRGANAWPVALTLSIVPMWICIGLAAIFLYLLWHTVRATEDRIARYSFPRIQRRRPPQLEEQPGPTEIPATPTAAANDRAGDALINNPDPPQDGPRLHGESDIVAVEATTDETMPRSSTLNSSSSLMRPSWSSVSRLMGKSKRQPRSLSIHTSPQDRSASSTTTNTEIKVNRDRSNSVKWQAIWYMTAFLASFVLPLVVYVLWAVDIWYDQLEWFAYLLFPLQGFFNGIIFCRPRRDNQMRTPEGRWFHKLVFCGGRCCCRLPPSHCCRRDTNDDDEDDDDADNATHRNNNISSGADATA